MGFIRVAVGSITSTLKDQWKDYYMPMSGVNYLLYMTCY